MDARGGKSNWKLLIVLAVVCGAIVFAAGFLHRRAVVDAVAKQQDRSAAVAKALSSDLDGVNVSKPAKGHDEKQLEKSVRPPVGTDIAIFSLDGQQVYATAGARGVDADRGAIGSASKGYVSKVIDGKDMIVYAPIPSEKKGQLAVAAVVNDYGKVSDAASGPLDIVRMPLMALAIVLLIAGLFLMVRDRRGAAPSAAPSATKVSRFARSKKEKAPKQAKQVAAKSAVSGFEPVPVTEAATQDVAEEAHEVAAFAPAEASSPKRFGLGGRKQKGDVAAQGAAKKRALFGKKHEDGPVEVATAETAPAAHYDEAALQREMMMRQALEDQLEQLRTRMQTQEEQAGATIRELREQLAAGGDTPGQSVGPAEHDMLERIRTMETELAQARQAAAEATAQVASLQRGLNAAPTAEVSTGAAELESQIRALEQQLEDAQRSSTESEQRAQSIESVRGELEVRVAQLGSKATELEQKAEEMETRLREANEGGDAVRAEIASLTAALAAAESRGQEFEAAGAKQAELEAEITRLRSELGRHMERAQAAEERVASLEADVLAAKRGVQELPEMSSPDPVVTREPAEAFDREPAEGLDRESTQSSDEPERVEFMPEREPAEVSVEPEEDAVVEHQATADEHEATVADNEATVADNEATVADHGTVEVVNGQSEPPEQAVETPPRRSWDGPSQDEPVTDPEPETQIHDGPATADIEPTASEIEPESVVETAPAWRQEWRPNAEPSPNGAETSNGSSDRLEVKLADETGTTASSDEPVHAEETPPAPSGDDRYDDVWATAFTEPGDEEPAGEPHANGSAIAVGSPAEPESAPQSPERASIQDHAEPAASAAETRSAIEDGSQASEDDRPTEPEDGMSVDDDLWALRARLAHAGESQPERRTPPAPTWD